VVVLNDAPPQLARAILTKGQRLLVRDVDVERAFLRTTAGTMTFLVEGLVELRRHLDHLATLAPKVPNRAALEQSLSLHNDVLFSLLMVSQLVIDIAGELSAA
jgi:hypothetical protein